MLTAWQLMDGLVWTALPIIIEMLGIDDIEVFIVQLAALRDWKRSASPESI